MNSYEINSETCAIIGVNDQITKVIEGENEYFVNKCCYDVMEDSCLYYGSTCDGRIKSSKNILGSAYKVPVVVEESNELIFFPTESPYSEVCSWYSLNKIIKYEDDEGFTKVTFDTGKELVVKMSIKCFENQVLRANRLGSLIKKRINK